MTVHQIAILVLSTLLFGMLWLRDFRRNRKDAMPLQGDDGYHSHTAFEIPESKWSYVWSNFRDVSLPCWQNYLLCWVAINLYAMNGTVESAIVGITFLLIFHLRQLYLFDKTYRSFRNAKASFLILPSGVCIVINPDDTQEEDINYNKVRRLENYVITTFIPWSKVTHVHVYSDNVAIESQDKMVQFFYEGEETLNDILRAVAPHFKKSTSKTVLLDFDEANEQMTEDAGLAIYLVPYAPDSEDRPDFTSIMGGRPNLPADIAWPRHNGVPMNLLAQIRISEIPKDSEMQTPESPLGEKGMLFFFADLKTSDRDDQESYKVIYLPDEPFVPERPYPDDLTEAFRFDEVPVSLELGLGFYDYIHYDYADGERTTTKATYDAVIYNHFKDYPMSMGHMFGGAQWEARSPIDHIKELQTDDDHFMLLQLQGFEVDEEGLYPLQLGRAESLIFFYIKTEDLERRDFTHVVVDWQ